MERETADAPAVPTRSTVKALAAQEACRRKDLLGGGLAWLLWVVPAFLFLLGAGWDAGRALLWIPSLAVAGSACVANAWHCGRLHCFLTGPLFLLGAVGTLLDAAGLVAIDWRWVLIAIVAGTAGSYGLEWIRGKYVRTRPVGEGSSP